MWVMEVFKCCWEKGKIVYLGVINWDVSEIVFIWRLVLIWFLCRFSILCWIGVLLRFLFFGL